MLAALVACRKPLHRRLLQPAAPRLPCFRWAGVRHRKLGDAVARACFFRVPQPAPERAERAEVAHFPGWLHPPSSIYYGWVLVVALGVTTIISYGTTQYLFGVLVVPLAQTFHWSRAQISGRPQKNS